jgi:DNA-binding transcriptional regulator LsrR (DeoR family)
MKPYSNYIRIRIIEFHKLGMRQMKIAESLKVHKSTVSRIIKLPISTNSCKITITTIPKELKITTKR